MNISEKREAGRDLEGQGRPPRRSRKGLWIGLAFAGLLTVGGIAAATGGSDPASAPAAPAKEAPAKAPVKPKAAPKERADLTSFKLDDRTAYGINDIWVKYTITNHSSKKSDYTFDWEALNSKGVRVASGTEYETNVLPGQTVEGDDFTTLDGPTVALHVTSIDRTESW